MIPTLRTVLCYGLLTSITGCSGEVASSANDPNTGGQAVTGGADSPASPATQPLTVSAESNHVVVMEFEPWFGPTANPFTHPNKPLPMGTALPVSSSADMIGVGGGYDSADPAIIAGQLELIEALGVDALLVDLSNAVGCIFDTSSESEVGEFAQYSSPQVGDQSWRVTPPS